MISTTTCSYSVPLKTGVGGMLEGTDAANNNFQFASTTCITETPDPITATNTAKYLNGFTYGELTVSLFLFFILTMIFFGGIINHVAGIRWRAKNIKPTKGYDT